MKILVCFKYVRDEADIKINPDSTLNLDVAPWMVSSYDLNAIEAAMQLAQSCEGSTVEALTLGGDEIESSKNQKAALARGPEKLYAMRRERLDSDNHQTAQLLAKALNSIGDFDLIICGEGSGDMYTQVLGNMLGAILVIPTLNAVSSLDVEDGVVIAKRNASCTERYALTLPALITVTSDISKPRIPSMKDILAAGKKPVVHIDGTSYDVAHSPVETVSILAIRQAERKQEVFSDSPEDLESFAKLLARSL